MGMLVKAIEILQQYWEQIKRLWVYIGYCADNDIRTPVCRDFWMWTAYVSLGLGVLIVVIIAKKILREQLEYYRNRKRLEARNIVADAETIEEAKWKGEDSSDVELSQEELAERMRAAMKILARQASPAPPVPAPPDRDNGVR